MDVSLFTFIFHYFAAKNIFLVKAFVCWNDSFTAAWQQAGISAGVRVVVRRDATWADRELHRQGALLDLQCPTAGALLDQASSAHGFDCRVSWLVLASSNATATWNELQSAAALLDSDLVLWTPPNQLLDVYRIRDDLPWMTTRIALNPERLTAASLRSAAAAAALTPSTAARRGDLRGIYIKAALIVSKPWVFRGWSDLRDRQIDVHPKSTYPLMVLVAEDLNFRWDMVQLQDYGSPVNGTFSGLAGLLARGRVHVGATSLFMRRDRMRVMRFVSETFELRSSFMLVQPATGQVRNVFVLPLSRGVWFATAATLAAVGAMLTAFSYLGTLGSLAALDDTVLAPSEAVLFALAAICQQGWHSVSRLWAGRVVMVCTWLASLFLFTAYSAKVVAILQAPSHAIRTLEDLAHSPITLAVQDNTYRDTYLKESPDPVVRNMWRRKLAPQGERAFLSVVEGMRKVKKGLFAFAVENTAAYEVVNAKWEESAKCALAEIEAFKAPLTSVPVTRHSPYRELLAVRLRWLRDCGLMERWKSVWLAERPRCNTGRAGFTTVGQVEVRPALYVLVTGYSTALLLLLGELVYHRVQRVYRTRLHTNDNATTGWCSG